MLQGLLQPDRDEPRDVEAAGDEGLDERRRDEFQAVARLQVDDVPREARHEQAVARRLLLLEGAVGGASAAPEHGVAAFRQEHVGQQLVPGDHPRPVQPGLGEAPCRHAAALGAVEEVAAALGVVRVHQHDDLVALLAGPAHHVDVAVVERVAGNGEQAPAVLPRHGVSFRRRTVTMLTPRPARVNTQLRTLRIFTSVGTRVSAGAHVSPRLGRQAASAAPAAQS